MMNDLERAIATRKALILAQKTLNELVLDGIHRGVYGDENVAKAPRHAVETALFDLDDEAITKFGSITWVTETSKAGM
jgi:hypothetical protein